MTVFVHAQIFHVIATFNGSDGNSPNSLVQGFDADLWGTTISGGTQNCGTVFKMSPAGALSNAHSFNCIRIKEPGGLILDTEGTFYGVSFDGGTNNNGTVFRVDHSGGGVTVLHNFNYSDGEGPVGIIQGIDGNFYGATTGGGNPSGYGTVFRMTPTGTLTSLYLFDFTHGAQPYAGLTVGADGTMYGTTYGGGAYGQGIIYSITTGGTFNVLYSFGEYSNQPHSPTTLLILGKDGNLYGATVYGGASNYGAVYQVTPSGVLTNLHSFDGTDGQYPGFLTLATDGNFYGATGDGGSKGDGTIYRITPAGRLTTLFNFNGANGHGANQMIQHTDGIIYGLASGTSSLDGCIFTLSLGLGPFVDSVPFVGEVGTKVIILGSNLTGTTAVHFNGTKAVFTVVSDSEITTRVPKGATTGTITVTTPSGILISNFAFSVL